MISHFQFLIPNPPCMLTTQPLTALVSQLMRFLRFYNHPFYRLTNTWLNTNRLVVNASKSCFMLLGNTKNSDYLQDIILNNVKLEHTLSTKLLGLHR